MHQNLLLMLLSNGTNRQTNKQIKQCWQAHNLALVISDYYKDTDIKTWYLNSYSFHHLLLMV